MLAMCVTERDVAEWPGSPGPGQIATLKCIPGLLDLQQTGPRGDKTWIARIKSNGVWKRVRCGTYPRMSLAVATERARRMRHPEAEPESGGEVSDSTPFGEIALLCARKEIAASGRQGHAEARDFEKRVQHLLSSRLWKTPLRLVRMPLVRGAIDFCRVDRNAQMAHTLFADIRRVLSYAVRIRVIPGSPVLDEQLDPNAHLIDDRIGQKYPTQPYPVVEIRRLGMALHDAQYANSAWQYKLALKILALTAQAPDEVANLKWVDLDLDGARWFIASKNARYGDRSIPLPLPTQVVDLLRGLQKKGPYVFYRPNDSTLPITTSGLKLMLQRQLGLGFQLSLSNFRTALARWSRLSVAAGEYHDSACIAFILGDEIPDDFVPAGAAVGAILQSWANHLSEAEAAAVRR